MNKIITILSIISIILSIKLIHVTFEREKIKDTKDFIHSLSPYGQTKIPTQCSI